LTYPAAALVWSKDKDWELMRIKPAILAFALGSFALPWASLADSPATTSAAPDSPPAKSSEATDEQRFERRFQELQEARNQEQMASFERDAQTLVKEFPKRPEPYQMLLSVAPHLEAAKRREVIEQISKSPDAPEEVKQRIQGMLKQVNAVGHPIDVRFTAVDGREVDLAKLKGKVVLVDFWATWCGPCVGEIPHVKEAYEKFHKLGFEIVGISLDKDKGTLQSFVQAKEMPWPQYFDGQGWQNKFAQSFGIDSIPAMWLLDRNGAVSDTNAREDLAGKVEHLLAAKDGSPAP
jgi:thiol-disulfide isomerase/thioredoxin